jgi:FkbM family methyltransferase
MPDAQFQYIVFRDFKNSYIPQILEETYIKKVYQPFVVGKKDLIVVDVGQNIGLTSYYFKDYAARVIGLEPSVAHREIINKMIELNDITNIECLPYALSNKNGTEKFFHNQNTTMFSLESAVNDPNDFEEVETVTMDKLFEKAGIDHIDICKLDPEGHEGHIIASPEFAQLAPKIKVVVGEWHSWGSMSKDQFMNTFRDLGYQFHWNNNTDAATYSAVRI